ncbi:Ribonuclease/ribotoxin [Hypoxylon trugodes]|uniref:Ribonuclease/ribotoxin n=1 Tax=Hypoxylon trugodes TaxID=326681 RepID=UPI00218CCF87|nr:Ribonuclease/ribotoxin [Hypoxylon trugodes]KAI1394269.1 Ribonuclease/ribotoxin [Hypoxylon trugodes]
MHFTHAILSLAFAVAPLSAAPVEDAGVAQGPGLFARVEYVNCLPAKNQSPQKNGFKVSVDNAKNEAGVAKFQTKTKSGDPHRYQNTDKLNWGVSDCDDANSELWEYPVFWEGANQKTWRINDKTKNQDKTPIRVVYANNNGNVVYCGIMTHSEVDSNYQGKGYFQKC